MAEGISSPSITFGELDDPCIVGIHNMIPNPLVPEKSPNITSGGDVCNCTKKLLNDAAKNCISHTSCGSFLCTLCKVKFGEPQKNIANHISRDSHKRQYKKLKDCLFYQDLPAPPPDRILKLSLFLEEVSLRSRLTSQQMDSINDKISVLNNLIQTHVSDRSSLRLLGSVLTGLAVQKISNVNLDLVTEPETSDQQSSGDETSTSSGSITPKENAAQLLSRIYEEMSQYPEDFENIKKDFNANVPRVSFECQIPNSKGSSKGLKTNFEILLSGQKSWETSKLIEKYCQLDHRVKILGHFIRRWAENCYMDNQETGSWPPHSFILMLISFLQKRPVPVLPYLQDTASAKAPDKNVDFDADVSVPDSSLDSILKTEWHSNNSETLGQLIIEFFKYYSMEFRGGKHVVSVRKPPHKPLCHKDKDWGTSILAIEEPFRPWLNLSRSVGNKSIFNDFLHMMRETYAYLCIPQTEDGPCFKKDQFEVVVDTQTSVNNMLKNMSISSSGSSDQNGFISSDESEDEDDEKRSDDDDDPEKDTSAQFKKSRMTANQFRLRMQLKSEILKSVETIDDSKLVFAVNFRKREWFRHPTKFCHICRKTGHVAKKCPTEELPDMIELPGNFPPELLKFYDDLFHDMYVSGKMRDETVKLHHLIAEKLEEILKVHLDQFSEVAVFGSSVNGFGTEKGDVDLCLTFTSNETGEGIDQISIIERLAVIIRNHLPFVDKKSVIPITQAKVPIVKFALKFPQNNHIFNCDISLYNVLGKSNSRLLGTYCALDKRVPVLGFIVKHFADVS